MDISKVLTDVILLERGMRKQYEDIAADADNAEIAKTLRILASESEDHARDLESRHGISVKSQITGEGVEGLLSLLSGRIAKLKEKVSPAEVLQEGIEIEGYMEELYKGLADNYELEEQLGEVLSEVQQAALKLSEVFRKIAADERQHQDMLQGLLSRTVKGMA